MRASAQTLNAGMIMVLGMDAVKTDFDRRISADLDSIWMRSNYIDQLNFIVSDKK